MTIGEMHQFTKRFNEIIKSKAPKGIKDSRLAFLMDDLEMSYSIPMLANSARMKNVNPFALQLYKTVSEARSL